MNYYEKAANAGSANGMNNIASMYEEGKGVEIDTKKAAEWREKANEIDSTK